MTLGKDVYEHYSPAGKGKGVLPLVTGCKVLEIGFGACDLMKALAARSNDVYGVDCGCDLVENAKKLGFTNVFHLDISEEPLPFQNDFFDAVYCYEVFEHLTNPHRLFYEIRRVLKPGRQLFFSVPAQEIDMGYGIQRHTFVYPGLLEKPNLERFFMQMYFAIEQAIEPGPTDWLLGRNYVLTNCKNDALPDVVKVITQNVSVIDLYGGVLSPESLEREIKHELVPYALMLEEFAKFNLGPSFSAILAFVVQHYPHASAFYLESAQHLLALGFPLPAKDVLAAYLAQDTPPEPTMRQIKSLLQQILDATKSSTANE